MATNAPCPVLVFFFFAKAEGEAEKATENRNVGEKKMGCCYEAESRIVVAISILSRSKTRRQWVHTVVGNLASAFHFGIPKVKPLQFVFLIIRCC